MIETVREFCALVKSQGLGFVLKYKLGLAREGKDFVTSVEPAMQPLRGPWNVALSGDEWYSVSEYDAFARVAYFMLGESRAEDLNDALHLYAAHPEAWGCPLIDPERGDLSFVELLAAFDRAGLNYIKPEYDILRGGTFEHKK